MTTALGNRKRQDMGTIIINGERFDGNDVTIRNGKVVIDGKPQAGELHGDVDVKVTDHGDASVQCAASVACGEAQGGAIQVAAYASLDNSGRKKRP
ncbi:MAG: hypothetical protein ACREB8_08235 [Pseudolabrys sp.]